MNNTRVQLPNGEYIEKTEIRKALSNYVYGKPLFEGTIARGMPEPEEQFYRETGIKFNPAIHEIYYMGADGYDYDEPMTPFEVRYKKNEKGPVVVSTSTDDYPIYRPTKQKQKKKKRTQIKIFPGQTIEEIVKMLQEAKQKGESVFCIFNGHELDSDSITLDSAYKEIIGITKEEFEQRLQEKKEYENNDSRKRVVRVTRKYKDVFSRKILPIIMGAALLPSLMPSTVAETAVQDNLGYKATLEHRLSDEEIQELVSQEQGNINMGAYVEAKEGDTFNQGSNMALTEKTIGEEFSKEGKEAGDYRVSGFSVVVTNENGQDEIIDYIEDFDGELSGINLNDFVNQVCQKHNLDPSKVKVRVHLGINPDITRLGWIDVTDLITKDDLSVEETITKEHFSGYIENFQGNTITLENGVTLKITDDNGNFLPAHSKVIGSDGQEYEIDSLNITSYEKETGKTHLEFQVNTPIIIGAALATTLAALVSRRKIKKMNEEAQKHPEHFEFENKEEEEKFVNDFVEIKEPEDTKTKFRRKFIYDEKDEIQKLSEDQVDKMNKTIVDVVGKQGIKVKQIVRAGGRTYIVDLNDNVEDVTDVVMPYIANIGSENEISHEGELTDEMRRKY